MIFKEAFVSYIYWNHEIKYPWNVLQSPNRKIKYPQYVIFFQSRNKLPTKFNTLKVCLPEFGTVDCRAIGVVPPAAQGIIHFRDSWQSHIWKEAVTAALLSVFRGYLTNFLVKPKWEMILWWKHSNLKLLLPQQRNVWTNHLL